MNVSLIMAAVAAGVTMPDLHLVTRKKRLRPCHNTNCTNTHSHNNAYCSAECCKAHRSEESSL